MILGDYLQLKSIGLTKQCRQLRKNCHLCTKFVELADQIQQPRERTNISHITKFLKVKVRDANNSVFGCVVIRDKKPKGGTSS